MLDAHGRGGRPVAALPRLVIAGAGGALGSEVTRQLIGSHGWRPVSVLTHGPMRMALAGVQACDVSGWGALPPQDAAAPGWPLLPADVAVVMFEPPRPWNERERALWTPQPGELPALARWLHAGGVRQVAVLVPHEAGRLPGALRHGLANLDEAAVAGLGFDSVLWLRASRPRAGRAAGSAPQRLAAWMLGIFKYMVPDAERPLASAALAGVLVQALRLAPRALHVLSPELLHAAAADPAPPAVLAAALQGPSVTEPAPGHGTIEPVASSSDPAAPA